MEYIIFAFLLGLLLEGLKYFVKLIMKGIIGEKIISVLLSGLPKEQYILLNSSGKIDGSLTERFKHVKNIKGNINADKEKVMNKVCPKCGGQLVQKKGKYGAFIGCSNYPECKYTRNYVQNVK